MSALLQGNSDRPRPARRAASVRTSRLFRDERLGSFCSRTNPNPHNEAARGSNRSQSFAEVKILDKLVLQSFIWPFAGTIAVQLFVFVPRGESVHHSLDWSNQTLIVPFAAVIASCVAFGELAKGRELLALNAAGVGLLRIACGPIAVCVFTAICIAATSYVLRSPHDTLAYETLVADGNILGTYFSLIFVSRYGRKDQALLWLGSVTFIILCYLTALILAVYSHQFVGPAVVVAVIALSIFFGLTKMHKYEIR